MERTGSPSPVLHQRVAVGEVRTLSYVAGIVSQLWVLQEVWNKHRMFARIVLYCSRLGALDVLVRHSVMRRHFKCDPGLLVPGL